ncbi:MAG TPA: MinD/ParA family protein [Bacilli bacterium]
MTDQAQQLRNLVKVKSDTGVKNTRIITVTSGKGGVGKSNFTLNFALALQSLGFRTLIFDADIGFANIDVLMGIMPKYNLAHLLKKEKTIWEIIYKGVNDVQFISGGSGFNDLFRLSEDELENFTRQLNELSGYIDFILFDTGAGLSRETLKFILAAQETIVVTTPEPTAITDAYAIIKMVHGLKYRVPFQLIVNRVADEKEGKRTAEKISMVAKQFLDIDIPALGYITDDHHVSSAVKKQVPFYVAYPGCEASRKMTELASVFIRGKSAVRENEQESGVKAFLGRLLRFSR